MLLFHFPFLNKYFVIHIFTWCQVLTVVSANANIISFFLCVFYFSELYEQSIRKPVSTSLASCWQGNGTIWWQDDISFTTFCALKIRSNKDSKPMDFLIEQRNDNNCKCQLFSDRDEMINHIISECGKSARREYKTGHEWLKKVIHWELCKKIKFDHCTKWYM